MKTQINNKPILRILYLSTIFVAGCLADSVDLVENQTLSLERVPTKNLYISWVRVYRQEDVTEVFGEIRRRHRSKGGHGGHGHIDVAVVDPDGTVLEEVSTLYYPRDLPKKSAPVAYFTVRLAQPPPPGSTVRLTHHQDGYSLHREFTCDRNAACPPVKETEQ
jgi:hypothetical protein